MKKAEEKKIRKQIIDLIGKDYNSADDILISNLIDWLKIAEQAKQDLEESIQGGEKMSWMALTTISMSDKAILNILKSLGITPQERRRSKEPEEKQTFDLQKFLNAEN